MILMLTRPEGDPHYASVKEALERRGEPFFVVSPADYPDGCTMTVDGSSTGYSAVLEVDGRVLDLSEVTSVWYRRPGKYEPPEALLPQEQAWLKMERSHFLRGVWANTDALWVSHPGAIDRAALKIRQLQLAVELGFEVPPYRVTNDVEAARRYLEEAEGRVINKVLASPAVFYAELGYAAVMQTHVVTAEDHVHLDAVRHGPTFLQTFVPKVADIRVTVFGEEVFPVAIDCTDFEEAEVDFRAAEVFDLPHDVIELPDDLTDACRELVRRLGLQFGAIDLLATPDGDYVFLEINPNGQWLWLEMATELPLTEALCDLLMLQGRPLVFG